MAVGAALLKNQFSRFSMFAIFGNAVAYYQARPEKSEIFIDLYIKSYRSVTFTNIIFRVILNGEVSKAKQLTSCGQP